MNTARCAALLLSAGALAAQSGYTGPSVLSRMSSTGQLRAGAVSFRPHFSVRGIRETGLTGFLTDAEGRPPDEASYGMQAQAGVYVYRTSRRTTVAFDYSGDYRHDQRRQYYNGMNHFGTLMISHQINARTQASFRTSAGSFARSFGGISRVGSFFRPGLLQSPLHEPEDELFDNRTDHLSSVAELTRNFSARLSASIGGGGFVVRRRAAGLLGVSGAMATADVGYRLTRHSTVSLNYMYVKHRFTQLFGGADIHIAGVNYSISLTRNWELGLLANGIRVETQAVRQVAVDPVVAAITGLRSGIEVFHAVNTLSGWGARLRKTFPRSALLFEYVQGVSPGNGLFLTSKQSAAKAQYSYTGIRDWNIGARASYRTLTSVANQLGGYDAVAAGVGFSREIGRSRFHLTGRFDVRKYNTDFTNFRKRTQTIAALGVSYSLPDMPLALW